VCRNSISKGLRISSEEGSDAQLVRGSVQYRLGVTTYEAPTRIRIAPTNLGRTDKRKKGRTDPNEKNRTDENRGIAPTSEGASHRQT